MDSDSIEKRSDSIRLFKQAQSRPYFFDQSAEFVNYWFKLPKQGLIPERKSVEPRDMLGLLPDVIILEADSNSADYRIRLIGTRNVERWGFEPTGSNYLNYAAPQQQAVLTELFSQVSKYPCGLILVGNELYTSGRVVRNEMILMPVQPILQGKRMLLGIISADTGTNLDYGSDTLASVFYSITASHFINIGAGVPD